MQSLLIPTASTASKPKPLPVDNSGKLLTKQVRRANRSTVILSYTAADATAMRALGVWAAEDLRREKP